MLVDFFSISWSFIFFRYSIKRSGFNFEAVEGKEAWWEMPKPLRTNSRGGSGEVDLQLGLIFTSFLSKNHLSIEKISVCCQRVHWGERGWFWWVFVSVFLSFSSLWYCTSSVLSFPSLLSFNPCYHISYIRMSCHFKLCYLFSHLCLTSFILTFNFLMEDDEDDIIFISLHKKSDHTPLAGDSNPTSTAPTPENPAPRWHHFST